MKINVFFFLLPQLNEMAQTGGISTSSPTDQTRPSARQRCRHRKTTIHRF